MILRGTLQEYQDGTALARAAAMSFAERSLAAAERQGHFAVALTGGGSPRELYRLLGEADISERIPWDRVHLFWGDDRCVPPGHPRSNFGMADELFVSRVPIPERNVHRIRGELRPEEAARAYAVELRDFFAGKSPRFDLVHLGLGDDGHVASLFPFDLPRLTARDELVLTSLHLPLGEPRVTLSFPVINAAARIEFLLPDRAGKARVARSVMQGPLDPFRIPAQLVRPAGGELVWLVAG